MLWRNQDGLQQGAPVAARPDADQALRSRREEYAVTEADIGGTVYRTGSGRVSDGVLVYVSKGVFWTSGGDCVGKC